MHGGGPIYLRLARSADADELNALEEACFASDRISLRSYRRLLCLSSVEVVVARGSDVGGGAQKAPLYGGLVLLYRRGARVGRVYSLAVAAQARRQGVAAQLLAEAERLARLRGCDRLSAEIRSDNAASLGAFHKAGFKRVGLYASYYEDGMDAVRVRKRIATI
jgi:ribosomal protein S18 acetylase RimI-like enzyme